MSTGLVAADPARLLALRGQFFGSSPWAASPVLGCALYLVSWWVSV